MLGKEQIRAVFSFGFKLGRKAAETTRNINNTLGTGTANERAVQWWFKKFCKGDESLEVEERSGWPSEVDSDQLRWSFKILLQLHDKLLQKSVSTILWSFSIWSRLERWKSSVSGCIMSWPQKKKKIIILKCHPLLFYPTMNHFWSDFNKKWILYIIWQWPDQWLDREAPKHFPKPNMHQKKVIVSVW